MNVFSVFVNSSVFDLDMPYRPREQIFQNRHHFLLETSKTTASFFVLVFLAQAIKMNLHLGCFLVFFSDLSQRRLRKSTQKFLDVTDWSWKDIELMWLNHEWILRYLLEKLFKVESPLLEPYLFCVVAHNSFVWNAGNWNSRPSFLKFFVQESEFFVSSISFPFSFGIKANTHVFHVIPDFCGKAYCMLHFHLRLENVVFLLKEIVA